MSNKDFINRLIFDYGKSAIYDQYPKTGSLLAGRYSVSKILKEGYTAVIIKCYDMHMLRDVAVKRFFPKRMTSELMNKVKTEASFSSTSNYLVMAESIFWEGDYLNAVMPFVEGESLEETLAHYEQIGEPAATYTAMCIAKACEDLHKLGIVATDIKSDNIMVQPDGVSKLIDLSSFEYIGKPTTFSLGTIPYAPKELLSKRCLCPSSDLFSLGVVYFEMLAGQETFDRETANWENIIKQGYKPDISTVEYFYPEASRIISKAIEPYPLYRYMTATDMFNDLNRHYQQLRGTKTKFNLTLVSDNGKQIKIPEGNCTIGYYDVGTEWEYVSTRHLEVDFKDGFINIRDAGSSNGTKLNGYQINGQWNEVKNGDILTLANCNLLVSLAS